MSHDSVDVYRMKLGYHKIFSNDLAVGIDASEIERSRLLKINDVFRTGVTKSNYGDFFHHLLWYEESICKNNLENYNMSNVPLLLVNDHYAFEIPGLEMKRPSLAIGDIINITPSSVNNKDTTLCEAVKIQNITRRNIIIIQRERENMKLPNQYFLQNVKFDIKFVLSRVVLERMHEAVQAATTRASLISRVFPTENSTNPTITKIVKYFNPLVEKNPEQKCAVEHIVAGSAGLAPYLLHGPPGTGKTVTVVEAILQLVKKNPRNRILVCADSNAAADNVAAALVKYIHLFHDKLLLRVNSKSRANDTLPACLKRHSNRKFANNLRSGACASTAAKRLMDLFPTLDLSDEEVHDERDFSSYNIVITTLSYSAMLNKPYKSHRLFAILRTLHKMSHVFVDEAAQASEPATLVPLSTLLTDSGCLVLAGDPCQLGPVCISRNAGTLGLGLSLMERLKTTCELYRADPRYVTTLRNNFRSDPAILQIPNDLFYRGQLRALAEEDPISNVDILGKKKSSRGIVFHGVLSHEQRKGKDPSFSNSDELNIVQLYIKLLITKQKVKPKDIGVVTPYNGQVTEVRSWLASQSQYKEIEVGTVEAFQGREKRVVLISTVRGKGSRVDRRNTKAQLGFLVDDARFNVALTRAKAKVIVIGNPHCLELDGNWRAYIEKCRELGTFYGYDPKTGENSDKEITALLQDLQITKTQSTQPIKDTLGKDRWTLNMFLPTK